MSREMIAVVQRACEAWGTGELVLLHDFYTPDVTADGGGLFFENEVVEGADAVIEGFASLIGAFERNELLPEGAIEVGDTLVVPLFWRGLPAGASSFVEQRLIGSFTFRDGRIAAMIWHRELDEALDAVGAPRSAAADMIVLDRPSLAEQER
jgi:SnoaL-like domain